MSHLYYRLCVLSRHIWYWMMYLNCDWEDHSLSIYSEAPVNRIYSLSCVTRSYGNMFLYKTWGHLPVRHMHLYDTWHTCLLNTFCVCVRQLLATGNCILPNSWSAKVYTCSRCLICNKNACYRSKYAISIAYADGIFWFFFVLRCYWVFNKSWILLMHRVIFFMVA